MKRCCNYRVVDADEMEKLYKDEDAPRWGCKASSIRRRKRTNFEIESIPLATVRDSAIFSKAMVFLLSMNKVFLSYEYISLPDGSHHHVIRQIITRTTMYEDRKSVV